MNQNKRKNIKDVSADTALTTILDVSGETIADTAKESITSLVGGFLIDAGASLLPGLSGAMNSYKRIRFESNMKNFAEELESRMEELKTNLGNKTDEQKQKLDTLFEYISDYVIDEKQEEKIKYIVNGFVRLSEHESVTEDFVLTYYDVLRDLRITDIAVLRLYYQLFYIGTSEENYQDVMEKHGITYEQYDSVRNNLFRLGIFTTKKDNKILDDLETLFKSIKEIQNYLEKLTNGKKVSKLKAPKMVSKDNFELSKFGCI